MTGLFTELTTWQDSGIDYMDTARAIGELTYTIELATYRLQVLTFYTSYGKQTLLARQTSLVYHLARVAFTAGCEDQRISIPVGRLPI